MARKSIVREPSRSYGRDSAILNPIARLCPATHAVRCAMAAEKLTCDIRGLRRYLVFISEVLRHTDHYAS